jgi:hypothetical protein
MEDVEVGEAATPEAPVADSGVLGSGIDDDDDAAATVSGLRAFEDPFAYGEPKSAVVLCNVVVTGALLSSDVMSSLL